MEKSKEKDFVEEIKKEKSDYTKKTLIFFDERMAKHEGLKNHPERPDRILSIYRELKEQKIIEYCITSDGNSIEIPSEEDLRLVHSKNHVDKIMESKLSCEGGGKIFFTTDTFVNEFSVDAALLAIGGLIDITKKVIKGEVHNGFAIIRPPGHHAEMEKAMGFCLYNNVAIVAKYIKLKMGIEKVLIVDWDVHHGNGTQQIFEDDPTVLYFSVHRYENGSFYPGTGALNECGIGKGVGYTVNVPWNKPKMGDTEYLACWDKILIPIAKEFKPELILVSAGFDCAVGDPLGEMKVTPEAFGHMTKKLCDIVEGKIVLALEGGYNLKSISKSASECVRILLGGKPSPIIKSKKLDNSAANIIEKVIQIQRKYWNCFCEEDNLTLFFDTLSVTSNYGT